MYIVHCTEYYTILYIDDSEAKSGRNKRDTETALGESPRRELVRVYCILYSTQRRAPLRLTGLSMSDA